MSNVVAANPLPVEARDELRQQLDALAVQVDAEGLYPADYLRRLGGLGGLAAFVPEQFGGIGGDLAQQIAITTMVGTSCGSTAFMLWAHSSCAWYLLRSPNAAARDKFLPEVARGRTLAGSGLSNLIKHLDGLEKIHLSARHEGGGYCIHGGLPWVSNLGDDHLMITAAKVEGEGYVMFAVPCDAPGLTLRPCPRFSGMEGTRTLNPRFRDVFIPADQVLAQPVQFDQYLRSIEPGFILLQVGMGLGIVEASIADIRRFDRSRVELNSFCDEQADPLEAELDALKARSRVLADATDARTVRLLDVLRLRAEVSELTLRAANAAVLAAGSRGYMRRSPIQRRLREATFVAIFTPALTHLRRSIQALEAREQLRVGAA